MKPRPVAPVAMPRPYLSTRQLAELTPWSPAAIEAKVRRGEFKLGVHYFQPGGRDGERVWKWNAIVTLIEGSEGGRAGEAGQNGGSRRGAIDVETATAGLRGLLDQPP